MANVAPAHSGNGPTFLWSVTPPVLRRRVPLPLGSSQAQTAPQETLHNYLSASITPVDPASREDSEDLIAERRGCAPAAREGVR